MGFLDLTGLEINDRGSNRYGFSPVRPSDQGNLWCQNQWLRMGGKAIEDIQ